MAAQAVHTEHGQLVFWTTPASSQEASMMRIKLQQALASKKLSEILCQTFQKEIKDLKEQLNMYESESQLGVFTPSSHTANRPSHDDSIADLGIRKMLNFASPQAPTRPDGVSASLRSELDRCLCRNRQQRAELDKAAGQIQELKGELQQTRNRIASLENTCADQQTRLQELDAVNKPGNGGVKAVEARLRREIEDLKRDMNAQLAYIEDYKTCLQELGESEAQLTEINAELSHQMEQMVHDFDLDKQAALESCQRTIEAVNRKSFDKFRQDIEERFQSEKTMLMEDSKHKLDNLNQALRSTQTELDNVKIVYVSICQEHAKREAELKESHRTQLEEQLGKITAKLEKEKREWESFMRAKLEKEQEEFKISLRQKYKLKEESPKHMGIMITAKLEKEKREWESFMRAKLEKEQEEFKISLRQKYKLKEESPKHMGIMNDASSMTPTPGSWQLSSRHQQNGPVLIDKLHLVEDNYTPLGNSPAKSQPGHADVVLELSEVKRPVRSDTSRQQHPSDVLDCVNSSGCRLGASKGTDGADPWDYKLALVHDEMSLEEVIQILNFPSRECVRTPHKTQWC